MNTVNIPKIFWKYFDLYRRKLLTLDDFQHLSNIDREKIVTFLSEIEAESHDDFSEMMWYNKDG